MFKLKASLSLIASLVLTLNLCSQAADSNESTLKSSPDPFFQNEHLGRGINLGNALDGPNEGDWGVVLKEEYFKIIKDASFDSVRIPIRWSTHAMEEAPYTIDETFFKRVDWAIENALKNNLYVTINMHHYNELTQDPAGHSARFLALWEQIGRRYKDLPDCVLFEPLNEPNGALTPQIWNGLLKNAIEVIRKSNPNRTIVIGPGGYNNYELLEQLEIPNQERNVIVTFHYYSPYEFTHQNVSWMPQSRTWLGITWRATDEQKKTLTDVFDYVVTWGRQNNRPINLGEFGVYKAADKKSRILWTKHVAEYAVCRGFSFQYWEFCYDFGVYDQQKNQWKEYLLDAIIPRKK